MDLLKDSKLPPAKFQYDVRCDLLLEDGESANVLLKGFSNPEIVYNSAKHNNSNKSLYNIDKATYKELFTISLDELNKSEGRKIVIYSQCYLGQDLKTLLKFHLLLRS